MIPGALLTQINDWAFDWSQALEPVSAHESRERGKTLGRVCSELMESYKELATLRAALADLPALHRDHERQRALIDELQGLVRLNA